MIENGYLRRTAVITVGLMIWLAVAPTLSLSVQEEDVLQRARRLIGGGDLDGAIKLLEDYILKIKAIAEQRRNLAEAYFTLAKSYYMAGEDNKSEANLRLVFETFPDYSIKETNDIFLARVVKIRDEVRQAALAKETLDLKQEEEKKRLKTAEVEARKAEETKKADEAKKAEEAKTAEETKIQNKTPLPPTAIAGTPAAGGIPKAKKKFPWLVVGGVAVVGILAAVLASKKSTTTTTVMSTTTTTVSPSNGSISISSTPAGAKAYLDGSDTGKTTPCTLTGISAGTHTLKIEIASYGKWEGSVQVVAGQTAVVNATLAGYSYDFVAKWGSKGSGTGQFDSPSGIAVDPSGNVIVSDTNNNRIQKFSSTGGFLASWGGSGTGDGKLGYPHGIAVDSSGNVYVADMENHRIQKFSSAGTFLLKWGSNGSGDGQFIRPYGITVDGSNSVYVAGDNRVQKFSSNGTFLAKWGSLGSGDGSFNLPYGIAVAPSGNVYVSEFNGNRVQQFTSSGTFVSKWGSGGGGDGQFLNPGGIGVDASGYCYVADSGNSRIQKFTSAGGFITKWGSPGSGDGQFNVPLALAVDSSGNLYICEAGGNRVQKFRIKTSTMSAAGITYTDVHSSGGSTLPSFPSPLLRRLVPGKTAETSRAYPVIEKKEPPKETIRETIR